MADQLATPGDLADALQATLTAATADLWLECATAVVQEAAEGQRILEVADDEIEIMGLAGSWLDLPQIPVTAVASVTMDGTALTAGDPGDATTTYRRHGNRLWRTDGWQTYVGEPSLITVVCTHGYPAGHQRLQLARSAVLVLARGVYDNPSGVVSEKIDDYAVVYGAMQAVMEASPYLHAALKRQYGRGGGLVRVG